LFFSLDGTYLRSVAFSIEGAPSGVEIGKDGRFIISESLGLRDYDFFERSGKVLSPHPAKERAGMLMPVRLAGGQLSSASDGTLLFSCIKEYRVLRLSWNGDTLATYQASPKAYYSPDLSSPENSMKKNEWAVLGVPLDLELGVVVQWFKRKPTPDGKDFEWQRYVDLFTDEGKAVALGIPSPYVFLCSRGDLLYAVDNPSARGDESRNAAVVAYRLIEKID
jgi:hypothetical protein